MEKLQEQGLIQASIPVLMFPSVGFEKRSRMKAAIRQSKIARGSAPRGHLTLDSSSIVGNMNVLILDDVLTSGGSLKRECESLIDSFGEKAWLNFHAMTLFRTPVAKINVKETGRDQLEQSL